SNPSTLEEDSFKAHIIEARFEIIAKEDKEHIVKKKIDVILPLQGEFASPEVKGSLDADEDIGVDDVSSAIDGVFHIDNKESVVEVVVGGGGALEVNCEKSRGAAKGRRMVLCYVQDKGRRKTKKMKSAI
ncbi:hypothetical protein Tco_1241376, partial [Tanacetum coccineum]